MMNKRLMIGVMLSLSVLSGFAAEPVFVSLPFIDTWYSLALMDVPASTNKINAPNVNLLIFGKFIAVKKYSII